MATAAESKFLDKWCEAAASHLQAFAGRPLEAGEVEKIRSIGESRVADRPACIWNSRKQSRIDTTLASVAEWAPRRALPGGGGTPSPAVWTGHGTLFKPQDEFDSVSGRLVKMLGDTRDILKGKMFDLIRAGVSKKDSSVKSLDQGQKIYKLLNNSWFGAQSEKGFHFFDPDIGPAITYTGRLGISATLWGFESFLTGNMWIADGDELARHVAECLRSSGGDPREDWGDPGGVPERDEVVRVLSSHCAPGWDSAGAARSIVSHLPEGALWSLALRGRPLDFLSFPRAAELLSIAMSGTIKEPTAKKMAEEHPEGKAALDELYTGLEKWVASPWLPVDLVRRAIRMRRRAVTLADTDSSFISLAPWTQEMARLYEISPEDKERRLTALNCMVYILVLFSTMQVAMLTKNMNVQPDRRKMLTFKNEFVFSRMVLTGGKKHYLGLITHQEGAEVAKSDQVEIKGLMLKKTTTAKSTSVFFEKALEERVLRDLALDRAGLLGDTVGLEERIRASIAAGSTEYAQPAVLGRMSNYANKWTITSVRGSTAWNAVYPNDPIREGDRVNTFRLKVGSDSAELARQMEGWPEGSEERNALVTLMETFFGTGAPEELSRNGLNWIAFPKDLPRLPSWVIPMVDAENSVQANVAVILPVLEAIGIRPLRNPAPESYGNSIPF